MADDPLGLPSSTLEAPHWSRIAAESNPFHALFDGMDDGYCVIEFLDGPHGPLSDYVHVAANPAYAANAGIENVVGQRLREMVPDEADAWVERYGHVLRTGERIHFEQELVATGRLLEVTSFRLGTFEDRLVAVLFKDATPRRRAEAERDRVTRALEARFAEALKERALFAEIVEGTDAFVQVCDTDLTWLAINKAAANEFERIYGVRPEVGQRATDLLADQPEHAAAVAEVWGRAFAGESFNLVDTFGDPGRARRSYDMRFNVLRDADGKQIGAYQFVYDVTDRVAADARLAEAEAQLRQSQKMEAVGQLTGGLAHDFNNLLGGIQGALELIQTRMNQGRPEDVARYLAAAQDATKRAASLTHRMLAFSRRQTLDPTTVSPSELVGEMLELIRRSVGPQIAIETRSEADLWQVHVDANQLENALLNLCLNSRDAMPDGGTIHIECSNRHLEPETAAHHEIPPGDYVQLCVSDSGEGIPADALPRVFEPFFTTKPTGLGTGLGLSMVYGFARQSNGYATVDSREGEGTKVCIGLPRHLGSEPREAGPAALQPQAKGGNATVLVVDDEILIRMTVTDELSDAGYSCLEAGEGAEALKLLAEHPEIDVLVTDVGLPGGLNGRQVADAAREARPDLRVLYITGYAENAALNDSHLGLASKVLVKPFSKHELLQAVSALLEEGPR